MINELDLTVTAFRYDAGQGRLTTVQVISTLPADASGDDFSTAEILVHPSGRFLYGSNRGHDSIAAFSIDAATGRLTFLEAEPTQGETPRNFAIDPTGSYLLAENQSSNSIVVFRVDPKTGRLDATGHRLEVPNPVCVRFLGTDSTQQR